MTSIPVNNFIWNIEGAASAELCQQIIKYSKDILEESTVLGRNNKARISDSVFLRTKTYPFLKTLDETVAGLSGKPEENQEDLCVIRYSTNGYYIPHFDFFEDTDLFEGSSYSKVISRGGQREFSFILYLNDVEEGGETSFPLLDLKFEPKRGNAILFKNIVCGTPNGASLHAGLPVIKGEKWIAVKWVRENKAP